MSARTSIEWTEATWNPVRGCAKANDECDNCYAMEIAHRFSGPGKPFDGLTRVIGGRGQWNGKVIEVPSALDEPLKWKAPRRIFVNSMSDLFHESVSSKYIDRVFGVMALAPRHTFQILTKRPDRMLKYMEAWPDGAGRVHHVRHAAFMHLMAKRTNGDTGWNLQSPESVAAQDAVKVWPLPNVHLGASMGRRAKAFDPDTCEYIIDGVPDEQKQPIEAKVETASKRKPGRPPNVRIAADRTNAVSVGRTAGG
jgi:hypothetical protein